MKIIKLQSSDGVVFMTDEETVKCSGTITIMLDCFEMETEPFIPLPNVHSSILEPILEWAEYHKKGKLNQSSDEVLQWRYDFMVKYEEILDSLVSSADYLDIANLLRMINIMNIVLRMRRFDRSAHQRGTQAELTHEEQVKLLDEID